MTLSDYELERQTITDIRSATATERAAARQAKAARRVAQTKAISAAAPSCPPLPRRRSGRNKGEDAPEYDGSIIDAQDSRSFSTNYQEELYNMDHVRALGSFKLPWVVFQDGFNEKGDKIYDKVNGKTCHQCRQKYLGKRTSCSHCQTLQGQFCGDCLFQRYGENLDEVNENPDWKCPNCRGLCNCSFHRSRRGWAPTGAMFPHAEAMGFTSVAHYLVLNNLEPGAREEALPFMPPELAEEIKAELNAEREEAVGKGSEGAEKEEEKKEEADVAEAAKPESENHDELQKGAEVAGIVGTKRKADGECAEVEGKTEIEDVAVVGGSGAPPARHGGMQQQQS